MTEPKPYKIYYESKGSKVQSQIVPWFAEKVYLEFAIKYPSGFSCKPSYFRVQFGDSSLVEGNQFEINDATPPTGGKVFFLLENPRKEVKAKVFFKKKLVFEIDVPYCSKEHFLSSIELQSPVLHCNFDNQIVACHSFLMTGCKGVSVSAVLSSKYGIGFLSSLDVLAKIEVGSVEPIVMVSRIGCEEDGVKNATVIFPIASLPKKIGNIKVTFQVETFKIGSMICQGVSSSSFSKMMQVNRQAFVVWKKAAELEFQDELEKLGPEDRFGPCFWLSTKVQGLVGFADIKVQGYLYGSHQPMVFWEGKVLATSTPALIAPVNLGQDSFKDVNYFEILSGKNSISMIKIGSKPSVLFTAEGTIASPDVFTSNINISVQDVFKKLQQFSNPN